MTLAEKLLSLRTEKGMSQEDLAEQLGVSRQSVSKWETGQSVPDLDKIIKLADLFGVSVDELVREGERPQPPEPKVIYVEREQKPERTTAHTIGVVLEVAGGILILFALVIMPGFLLIGMGLILLGLPFLLAKKHPFLIAGWLILVPTWYLLPLMGMTPRRIWFAFEWIYHYFAEPGPGREAILLGGVIAVIQHVLLAVLAFFTGQACWRAWKKKKEDG